MSSEHSFDCHLSLAKGVPAEQKRTLGNALLEEIKRAANEWQNDLDRLVPSSEDLTVLPDGSWLLRLVFRLSKPFTSKSEVEMHHYKGQHEVQNPIVRDHLMGLPMVRPTTWKGHFRFAAKMETVESQVVTRLFGESRDEETGRAGRLRFFPTFFIGDVEREVITPLKRDTRTPDRGPIDIEVVPTGATGIFCLLYLPYPRKGVLEWQEVAQDLEAATKALRAMLLEYGFSAKKTAGWGVVEDSVQDSYFSAKGQRWPEPGQKREGTAFQESAPDYLPLMEATGDLLPHLLYRTHFFY